MIDGLIQVQRIDSATPSSRHLSYFFNKNSAKLHYMHRAGNTNGPLLSFIASILLLLALLPLADVTM
jgi:hypothetical protein